MHCAVLISKAIITPGSATGQTLAHAGLPCAMSPNENEQPRRGLPNRGRWISAAQTPAPDVPPAAPERLAAALIPLFRSNAVVWTTDITQLPRRPGHRTPRLDGASPHRRQPAGW
jgi:hypothetical protein